jgi:PPOX class probable F420-dependent enzyme
MPQAAQRGSGAHARDHVSIVSHSQNLPVKERFAAARVARLATIDGDGNPHLVPICFAVEGDTVYSAVDAKPKTTPDLKRLRNIGQNPNVTLLVDHYDDDWTTVWWVRVDGRAEVRHRDRQAVELLAAKYRQYADEPGHLGRIVVVHATKWTSWAYTDPV